MRSAAWGVAAVLALSGAGQGAVAQMSACAKADFEAVVNEAGAALRDLNRENTPRFQGKLRELKDKRGWGNDQFLKEAEPFVRDGEIVAYDHKSEQLLNRITGGGQQGSTAAAPDCAVLAELRAAMKVLVETQKAKWTHMFAKIDKELAK
ncbi:MAG: hypothetical protein K2X43_14170 [Hyphomonadaceae bacterium]|jgi:hypothetical protein|nr:hypothetical protein [Hyphomonadaceae bacterium]